MPLDFNEMASPRNFLASMLGLPIWTCGQFSSSLGDRINSKGRKQGRQLPSQESYLDAHLVVRAACSFAGVLRVRPPALAPAVIEDGDDLANAGSKLLQS